MNATVAWSYQLLDPDEQRAVPPSRRAAGTLSDRGRRGGPRRPRWAPRGTTSTAGGGRLIDKSLLLRARRLWRYGPLYHMLETVRAYAALELTAAGERDDAMEGLVRYCSAEASWPLRVWSDPRRSMAGPRA